MQKSPPKGLGRDFIIPFQKGYCGVSSFDCGRVLYLYIAIKIESMVKISPTAEP